MSRRGNYAEYFGLNTNVDACVYLMLANEMIHRLNPEVRLRDLGCAPEMPQVAKLARHCMVFHMVR
jgi:hypothetical protein